MAKKALALKTLINIVDPLDITTDMLLCDVTKNGCNLYTLVQVVSWYDNQNA